MKYALIATISTHARPTVRQGHNRRDPQIVKGEPHIDPNGIHESWLDVDEEAAFREVFGAAVERYNAKQAREDRKITSYYQQIKAKELEVCLSSCKIGSNWAACGRPLGDVWASGTINHGAGLSVGCNWPANGLEPGCNRPAAGPPPGPNL